MISEVGFYVYLYNLEVQLGIGILSLNEYFKRIIYLYSMVTNESQKGHLQSIIGLPVEIIMDLISGDNKEVNIKEGSESDIYTENGIIGKKQNNDEKDIICFLTTMPGCLKDNWMFHKGDVDYWPSIPHGHLEKSQHIKLDSYRGNTYDTNKNNKELQRESKHYIASLWNDDAFRAHSLDTLNHFILSNPTFSWVNHRGIVFPYKLPRKRK